MKNLHILNGDSTAWLFEKSGLTGEVLVWREMLSEGWVPVTRVPATGMPATDDFREFWQQRGDFLASYYGIDREEYRQKVEKEVYRLVQAPQYDEITLWFEFDLFCQINLLYLLNWFAGQNLKTTRLTLVCPGSHPEVSHFKGLGELSPAQLAGLYPTRRELSPADLRLGQEAWTAYASPTTQALRALLATDQFGPFVFLKKALTAHLNRFPAAENGLGSIERFWLEGLQTGQRAKPTLMQQFWNAHPEYGLGDFQLLHTLNQLEAAGLVQSADAPALTPRGQSVLMGQQNYLTFAPSPRWLGGVELRTE